MLTAQPLTEQAFAPYGRVFTAPDSGRISAAILRDDRPGTPIMLGMNHLPVTSPRIATLERHRHAAQCFIPMSGGRLLVVVAPSDAAGMPDVSQAEAFLAGPLQGFEYHPGTWHAGLAALDAPAVVAALLGRDGSAEDVELWQLGAPLLVAIPPG